jgi:hypothetical protein
MEIKHAAEMKVMEDDIRYYRLIIERLVKKFRVLMRQKQKQDVSLLLMKKLQDQNNSLKLTQAQLSQDNINLSTKFSQIKQLVIQFEKVRLKQFNEAEAAIQ